MYVPDKPTFLEKAEHGNLVPVWRKLVADQETPLSVYERIRRSMPGLSAPATVYRDGQNIAHITAKNRHDLYFVTGWIHAEDRLFQADLTRRQPSGTLAELFGPSVLADDVQARTIGLRR